MEFLTDIFVEPFVKMYADAPWFLGEVIIGGLLAGVMYSLVALGFVLIFKASGMVNFAQGYFVLFAALTLVGLMEGFTISIVWWLILGAAAIGFHFALTGDPERRRTGMILMGGGAVLAVLRAAIGVEQSVVLDGYAWLAIPVAIAVAIGFGLVRRQWALYLLAAAAILFVARLIVGTDVVIENSLPLWAALLVTVIAMIGLAFAVERTMLRYLVNQDHIILFMATIGLSFFMEGFGETIWGSDVRAMDVGLPTGNWMLGEMLILKEEVFAGIAAALLVAVLAVFFQKTRIGRALRAVADDHQAALSVGISLRTIWIIVWSVAGLVALVAGIVWGSKSGVQFSLSLIALKALPVLILGGFTSVPGAIVGGLLIGLFEKLGEVYWGPQLGGAIESWFAYMVAMIFLLFRPQGIFGEKIIERV